jgi:hypothetical protein
MDKIDKWGDEIALYCCDRMDDNQRKLLRVILAIVYAEGQRAEINKLVNRNG